MNVFGSALNGSNKYMSAPQLTKRVEKKILSIIDTMESHVFKGSTAINSQYYQKLADLYHFQKDFLQEAAILKRYVQLETVYLSRSANDDLVEIYERIDRAYDLEKCKRDNEQVLFNLELEPRIGEVEKISLSSNKKTVRRINSKQQDITARPIKCLAVCAAYTGRGDQDEILQLALVLFEYQVTRDKPSKVLRSLITNRKPLSEIPEIKLRKFGLTKSQMKTAQFDSEAVAQVFSEADIVISHNHADIERKLIATLLPDAAKKPWYSSQKDIPWGALGYESKSLSQIVAQHGDKLPRTTMDRANAIYRLLISQEPYSENSFLERLYALQPMKEFEWTQDLLKKHHQLQRQGRKSRLALLIGSFLFIAGITGLGYWLKIIDYLNQV